MEKHVRWYEKQLFAGIIQRSQRERLHGCGCLECRTIDHCIEQGLLERLVCKKLERGKSAAEIADELEIELAVSKEIISRIASRKK